MHIMIEIAKRTIVAVVAKAIVPRFTMMNGLHDKCSLYCIASLKNQIVASQEFINTLARTTIVYCAISSHV